MSTVIATSLLPDSTANDTLTVGGAGDSVNLPGNLLTVNSLQDAGGNNTFVSNGSGVVTSTGLPGAMKFISAQTASAAANVSFTSGLDSTYDLYIFKFIDVHPATDGSNFQVNFSSDGGSNYNMMKTTTIFQTTHYENNSDAYLSYSTGGDLAQSTAAQEMAAGVGNSADECCAGTLQLFAPSSSQFVKHFYSRLQEYCYPDISRECYAAGYVNSTSPINAVHFKMSSGNLDGIIAMYGISKS